MAYSLTSSILSCPINLLRSTLPSLGHSGSTELTIWLYLHFWETTSLWPQSHLNMTVAVSSDLSGSEPHFCVGFGRAHLRSLGTADNSGGVCSWCWPRVVAWARRTTASRTNPAAGTRVLTPDGRLWARRPRPGPVGRSGGGGGGRPAHRAVRPAHARGEEPERSREERSGGPGSAESRTPRRRQQRRWRRRRVSAKVAPGPGPDGAGRSPLLRGRLWVPRVGSGLERGSEGRKRGLRAPWAAEGEWERGQPGPTDARARGSASGP